MAGVFYLWDNILAGHKNNLTLLCFLRRIPIKILLFEFAEGMEMAQECFNPDSGGFFVDGLTVKRKERGS